METPKQNTMRAPAAGAEAAVPAWVRKNLLLLNAVRPAASESEKAAFRSMASHWEPYTKVSDQQRRMDALEGMAQNLAKAGEPEKARQAIQRALRKP